MFLKKKKKKYIDYLQKLYNFQKIVKLFFKIQDPIHPYE